MTPDEVRDLLFRARTRRDRQREIGPSELGGCRRKVWHRIQGTPVTNPGTDRLAASIGTATHTWIENRLKSDKRFLLETAVTRDGMTGHVDCFDVERGMVIDWKTTKMSNLGYFPSEQYVNQVQVYGWLMSTKYEVRDVCIVAIPKDGTSRDIVTHVEPYSEAKALAALEWLEEIRRMTDAPRPEKDKKFCRSYCQFYDPTNVIGCPGK